jgi:hypothetical protein
MTFRPSIWHPVAVALSVLNAAGFGYAIHAGESRHAIVHAVLAVAFGWWALRLRRPALQIETQGRLGALEAEMTSLRQELSEAQERLDFAERMLAQRADPRRVGPEQ